MGRRESSDSHRYIDRGGRRFVSVGLAQARPNYPGHYDLISSVSVVCVPIIHYIITKQAHMHSNQTHIIYSSILDTHVTTH